MDWALRVLYIRLSEYGDIRIIRSLIPMLEKNATVKLELLPRKA